MTMKNAGQRYLAFPKEKNCGWPVQMIAAKPDVLYLSIRHFLLKELLPLKQTFVFQLLSLIRVVWSNVVDYVLCLLLWYLEHHCHQLTHAQNSSLEILNGLFQTILGMWRDKVVKFQHRYLFSF